MICSYARDVIQRFLVLAGHDLDDLLQRVLAVARVDAPASPA